MPGLLSLESFEDVIAQDETSSEDYNRGYEEGLAAGTAAAQEEIGALQQKLVQAICDIDFTYAEARGQLLHSLAPLFSVLTTKILPYCVENGFAEHVANVLQQAAKDDANAPISLFVHPESYDAVVTLKSELPQHVTIHPDASLGIHAAWIEKVAQGTLLDTDALLAEITTALSLITHPETRTESNG